VDNSPSVLEGMRKFLQDQVGVIDTVATAEAACALVRKADIYNVLLLDYHLNDSENGIACMLELKKLCDVMPEVILVSADTSEEVIALARTHHIRFLAKPVKPAALLNLLRKHARELTG
jgi:DNA-binding NtrC family response regulator